ncbi:MAG: peptidoglycan DD-metalloendopeptidase family protein [Candidatus Peregrinibacteria bacterium]|nr:peptidoglycan DD-metalloendopeptidase family protein [Candidatus Peregrinibacteria bacterium]MCB9807793.1 peptidoglycan DD-metalloendopeptidase family protein [Candidatus Peribacteria bacterium]
MTPVSPTHRWLMRRVRIVCIGVLCIGSFLPPYIPKAALAPEQDSGLTTQQFLLVEEGFIKKTSPLTSQGARRAYAKGTIHLVKEGDSLERLARWYKVSVETIQWANHLSPGETITPGDELLILPVDGVVHAVARGQTLSRIAQLYDIDMRNIMDQNELKSEFIMAGQQLIIPGGKPIVDHQTVATVDQQPTPVEQKPTGQQPVAQKPSTGAQPKPADEVKTQQFTATPTAGVLQRPCSASCYYTQGFHTRHFAVDMQEKTDGQLGGPIFAAEDGTVIRADYGWNGGYGNVIEIDHGNGLVTLYGHNEELFVQEGDHVKRGQTISAMGNTGMVYGATGIHVHFEVRVNGVKKNPKLYLE